MNPGTAFAMNGHLNVAADTKDIRERLPETQKPEWMAMFGFTIGWRCLASG
jgi:hypothetical protein